MPEDASVGLTANGSTLAPPVWAGQPVASGSGLPQQHDTLQDIFQGSCIKVSLPTLHTGPWTSDTAYPILTVLTFGPRSNYRCASGRWCP